MEGVESRVEPRPGAKAALSPVPPAVHTTFFLALLSPQKPKNQLFSDQNVFRNKPSGAFPHGTGRSLLACCLVAIDFRENGIV